jgi:hypothetical protein
MFLGLAQQQLGDIDVKHTDCHAHKIGFAKAGRQNIANQQL